MNSFENLPKVPRAVALGVFDGVHIGHQAVMDAACNVMENDSTLRSCVLSITGVPKDGKPLIPYTQAKQFAATLGVDEWLQLSFEEVCNLSPAEFVADILQQKLFARLVVCGFNYRFGKGGVGTADTLKQECKKRGIYVRIVPAVEFDGTTVSTTRIRTALEQGDVATVSRLLGRPYTVYYPVTHGKHLGTQWNIPTINQVFDQSVTVPRFGVYASRVTVNGAVYRAVTNIGVHPTVGGTALPQAETWIADFNGDLYEKNVEVQLVRFLRDERQFASTGELTAQIKKDRQQALTVLDNIE